VKTKNKPFVLILAAVIIICFIAYKNHFSLRSANSSGSDEFIIINWRMTPSYITDIKKPVLLTFHLKNKLNLPITDAEVAIVARNIIHPEGAINAEALHDQLGFYKAVLKLNSPGDWAMLVTIKRKNGITTVKELSFSTNLIETREK
jgi:hypothetical protein